jgi:hypothetical protein
MTKSIQFKYVFLISTFIIIIINLTFGTYYLGYERLFNSFFLRQSTSQLLYDCNYNVWFLIAPVISYLTNIFVYAYDLLVNIYIILNLSILTYNILVYYKLKKTYNIIIINILLVIFFKDIIIFYSNRTIIVLIIYNLIFTTHNIHINNINNNIGRFLIVILIILANFLRFELSVLLLIIAIIIIVIYRQLHLLKSITIYLFISMFFFTSFHILQNTVYINNSYMEKSEHEFYDRGINYHATIKDKTDSMKAVAYSLYLLDDDNLDKKYYSDIILNKKIIFNKINKDYFITYLNKIFNFYLNIYNYYLKNIVLFLFIISIAFMLKINKLYKILITILFISIIQIIMSLYFEFPSEIYVTIISLYILSIIIYIYNNYDLNNYYIYIIIMIFIMHLTINIRRDCINYNKTIQNDTLTLDYYRKIEKYANTNNIPLIYASLVPKFENYNLRMFSSKLKNINEQYYLMMGFHSHYKHNKNHNSKFFSKNSSFKARISDIINKDAILISNNDMNAFIIYYSLYVCNLKINIKELDTIKTDNRIQPFYKTYKVYYLE